MKRTVLRLTIAALAFGVGSVCFPLWGPAGAHPGHIHSETDPEAPPSASPEQIKKRLDRVIKRALERKQKREQRQRDRRRALEKRLHARLEGRPVTPQITAELRTHAERVARLREIRYVAATKNDHESVEAADKALARENARHERWWRSTLAPPKSAPDGKPEPEAGEGEEAETP